MVKLLRQLLNAAQNDLRRGIAVVQSLQAVARTRNVVDDSEKDSGGGGEEGGRDSMVDVSSLLTSSNRLTFRVCEPEILLVQREWIELLHQFSTTDSLLLNQEEKLKIDLWKGGSGNNNNNNNENNNEELKREGMAPRVCAFWFISAINARTLEIPHLVCFLSFHLICVLCDM